MPASTETTRSLNAPLYRRIVTAVHTAEMWANLAREILCGKYPTVNETDVASDDDEL